SSRLERDGQLVRGPVEIDALDQQLDDAGLLAGRQRVPYRVEGRQRLLYFFSRHLLAAEAGQLLGDLRGPPLGEADALVQVRQPRDVRRAARGGTYEGVDLGVPANQVAFQGAALGRQFFHAGAALGTGGGEGPLPQRRVPADAADAVDHNALDL